jgi:membrane protein
MRQSDREEDSNADARAHRGAALRARAQQELLRAIERRPDVAAACLGLAALGAAGFVAGRAARQGFAPRRPSPDATAHRPAAPADLRPSGPHPAAARSSAAPGRHADTPTEMPPPAWREIFWRVKAAMDHDRVLIVAAGVTFYAILSLFPMIAAFVALYGLFADRGDVASLVEGMRGAVPAEVLTLMEEQLDRLMAVDAGALSLTSLIALAVAFWSANGGVKGLIEAMNVAYNEREGRSFVKLNLTAMSMTLGGMALVATLIALSAVIPVIVALFPGDGWRDMLLLWGRWPVMAGLLILGLAVIYRFGPDRRAAKWRWITPGAMVAAVGMIVVSVGFSFYTANFAAYGDTYGSLGTVIVVMMWFWLTSIVVILGAEINAEIEHQTAEDSTIGPDRPMGEREARMADTVASS